MADPQEPPRRRPPRRRPPRKPNGDDGDAEQREPHEEEPDAVRIHEAYLEHRRGGGEEPDPEAHLRSIEEFERLPGAHRTTPPTERDEPTDEEEGTER